MVPQALSDGCPEAVVIGGSSGSVAALGRILPRLPAGFPPVLVVAHVLPSAPSLLAELFAPRCAMRVCEVEAFEPIVSGSIYFAPSDYHLMVEPSRRCALSLEPPLLFSRPSIDVLFETAAIAYGPALLGVVLTGASADGAAGLRAIRAAGGRAWIQEAGAEDARTMPGAAMAAVPDARVLPLFAIAPRLKALAENP